ncbi:MAG: helix-turn-helix transcriptional regulator [Verrucomicrobiales bacterium]|jgi:hypothetical protein|nr:helix-turn-helix transcriptional regulator [Verrucomicrobiales bacterium]
MKPTNKHRGSSLDDLLKADGLYEEVCAAAAKRIIVEELQDVLQQENLSLSSLARKMQTSRAVVQRLLDRNNTSITLQTMERAARAVGRRWQFALVAD